MSKTVKHLENLCVIHVDFDIWSGQTRLAAADFKLGEGGEIPPEKVAQLGSKKICDPAKLKGFNRLKTETRRLLLAYGMPFMNGFAVPASKSDEICSKLNEINHEFEALKQSFLSGYNAAVNEWISENPEYEMAIRAGALPRSVVEKRIGFEYQVFMIQPINDDDPTAKNLDIKIESLGRDLLDEVTDEADKFYSKNLSGRVTCSVTTRITLKNIRDKVDGLSFLNGSLTPLVDLLDETIRGYEQHSQGRVIQGAFFYKVVAAVLIMSSRQRIEEYAEGAVTLASMTDSVTPDVISGADKQVNLDNGTDTKSDNKPLFESLSAEEGKDINLDKNDDESNGSSTPSEEKNELVIESLEADIDKFFEQFADQSTSNEGDGLKHTNHEPEEVNDYKIEKDPEYAHETAYADEMSEKAVVMPDFEDEDAFF
ncbi:DUF3150 domain-containing protein [Pseudoalteromonas sp. TAB23]|uniref:DUF3150 domain-containing protein n=1 Tax=Pseudoalteromonas sp. TAB23 TaxID=1938595 RepID=UPI0003FDED2E|nr:DUF3150 domain-containing protein [Pseudoalteromonas sp. TAB23]